MRCSRSTLSRAPRSRSRAASSSRSYDLRSVASKTVVRTTRGSPSASRSSTEFTSTGSRRPSADTTSTAISRTTPCMRSIGA